MIDSHLCLGVISAKRSLARQRNFGVIDEDRRELIRHGYLLALEEVEKELDSGADQRLDDGHAA